MERVPGGFVGSCCLRIQGNRAKSWQIVLESPESKVQSPESAVCQCASRLLSNPVAVPQGPSHHIKVDKGEKKVRYKVMCHPAACGWPNLAVENQQLAGSDGVSWSQELERRALPLRMRDSVLSTCRSMRLRSQPRKAWRFAELKNATLANQGLAHSSAVERSQKYGSS